MKTEIIAFTQKGCEIGEKLNKSLEDSCFSHGCGKEKVSLSKWSKNAFETAELIIFISAVGIAVRAAAPYIKSKTHDPAVIVIDDNGKYCIPLLSGHIGGANEYAIKISGILGSVPVITTATDINNVWAVDIWAKKAGLKIINAQGIKKISSKLLNGEKVSFFADNYSIEGKIPENVEISKNAEKSDIVVSVFKYDACLCLVPSVIFVGIGCRKNIEFVAVESLFLSFLEENNINIKAVKNICSIDIKKDEKALVELSEKYHIPFITFSADELNDTKGDFSASDFVKDNVGTDNVCERSAVCGSKNGKIIVKKTSRNGVTIASAAEDFKIKF